MSDKKTEALKLALEALKKCDAALAEELAAWDIDPPLHHVQEASNACGPAITAIRESLAEQPAQEPVAWINTTGDFLFQHPEEHGRENEEWFPLVHQNTSPPASKPLTDAQIGAVAADIWGSILIAPQSYQAFARAIEAAHGITGETK